jgi:hypothetical protein
VVGGEEDVDEATAHERVDGAEREPEQCARLADRLIHGANATLFPTYGVANRARPVAVLGEDRAEQGGRSVRVQPSSCATRGPLVTTTADRAAGRAPQILQHASSRSAPRSRARGA